MHMKPARQTRSTATLAAARGGASAMRSTTRVTDVVSLQLVEPLTDRDVEMATALETELLAPIR